jgi:hypothetical protein
MKIYPPWKKPEGYKTEVLGIFGWRSAYYDTVRGGWWHHSMWKMTFVFAWRYKEGEA